MLAIACAAELFLGAYFMLAFFAWFAKLYLFTAGNGGFSVMLIVWIALAAGCFALYNTTRKRMKEIEEAEEQAKIAKMAARVAAIENMTGPSTEDSENKTSV